jgi:putative two-component system response regulator
MKQSVLIVDDTTENIDVLEAILSDEYKIKAATRGRIALRIAEKAQPDIILLDIMMPEMDGYEVCKKLKENPLTSHIPVIFVTAMNEEKDEAQGFTMGAVDYVTKPVSPVIVKARLRTHLALSNQQRELDKQVKEKTSELEKSRLDLVQRLGRAAEYKDNETGLHVVRMSKYCKLIAAEYGLSDKEADLIELAAPMHDVGKIGIEDRILKKPGKLDSDEWSKMQEHSMIGSEILGIHNDDLLDAASIMALQHHEKWNGKGYPNGLKKDEIHLYARIVAVADVFDALTSKRPYKDPWPTEKAINLIQEERGEHFDPIVVDAFMEVKDEIIEIMEQFSD